jgi:Fe-S cluster assembly ATPase SufC
MYKGQIVASGNPDELIPKIEELGYVGYLKEAGLQGGS